MGLGIHAHGRLMRTVSAISLLALAGSLLWGKSAAAASDATFTDVTAGNYVSCGLTAAGAVKCWGFGRALGAGEHADSSVPIDVIGLASGATSISAGGATVCAVR